MNTQTVLPQGNDGSYNGWSNYATWRINLEMIDSDYWYSYVKDGGTPFDNIPELADAIKDQCEEYLSSLSTGNENSMILDYAMAFLDDVNWYEIAEHIADDASDIIIDVASSNE